MWEFFERVWSDFSKVLNPVSLILFALLIWAKVENYLMRLRIGKVLSTKDVTIADLTQRNINSLLVFERLTNLLETLIGKLRR